MSEANEREPKVTVRRVDPPPPTAGPPPGWYPDPTMVNTQRYWDGRQWTDNAAPAPWGAGQAYAGQQPFSSGLEAVGWIGALVFPILGAVIGLVMAVKGHNRGVVMLLVSVAAFVFWFYQLSEPSPY